MTQSPRVLVVGAGLAGSEASLYLADRGLDVYLAESKALKLGPAQKTTDCVELVCTNSLKSQNPHSGHGLLKHEMKALGSHVLQVGETCSVPAGDALAVDRDLFAQKMTARLKAHPQIHFLDLDVENPQQTADEYQCQYIIIASGPLTTKGLEEWIVKELAGDDCYFYDSIAPVIDADSIDTSVCYSLDRHKKNWGEGDYLNIPLNQEQYENFVQELNNAQKVPAARFEEQKFFEACLPIDIMAQRGVDTLRFSCLRPVGLETEEGKRPYAVVQLRRENLLGSAYNMVGMQNRLTYGEQKRVFRMLPGLEKAEFLHLGSVHRNTFLNAKKLLNFDLSSQKNPHLYFAGQITGVEGYTESASMGLYVAHQLWRKIQGKPLSPWPIETAIGALIHYLMTAPKAIPSNINFGLLPTMALTKEERKNKRRKSLKKEKMVLRAHESLNHYLTELGEI